MDAALPLIIAGFAAVGLMAAIFLAARGARAPALDEALARRRLAEDWQDFEAAEVWIAADRRAALATDRRGPRLGLVFAFGDKLPSRLLGPGDIRACRLENGRLVIETRDFGRHRFTLVSTGEVATRPWADRLAGLARA
ncbi:hypothetical protein [Zavarzinia compransoris]|uniref:DUF2550 domain-containing protein n=1 Tax=Zavarzinia compransoris TaxID=1264899 RepID=A0A317E0H4_9PROT|nr:hypothetical protein [Zavarzinia compransoris]PWR20577.1 hypothetical protein DKG75_11250 [Zavarzinia compransoris]TDP43777.1 hypothetical protein DES42_10933 [Zavarzinia compransoris]